MRNVKNKINGNTRILVGREKREEGTRKPAGRGGTELVLNHPCHRHHGGTFLFKTGGGGVSNVKPKKNFFQRRKEGGGPKEVTWGGLSCPGKGKGSNPEVCVLERRVCEKKKAREEQ